VEIIGHRGFSARSPENTLVAVRRALAAGADAVEWDLHVAACGTPVLIHDATLERTTDGAGPVSEATLEELRALDAGSWFAPEFRGEKIPTFAEALQEVSRATAAVYAEVKGIRELGNLDRMASIAHLSGMVGRTAFISLDFGIADGLAHRATGCRIGYVVAEHGQFVDAVGRARRLGPRGLVDLDYRLVLEDPDLVPRARAQGVDVAVWTVDDPGEADLLEEAGVRRITTNEVESLVRWRGGRRL